VRDRLSAIVSERTPAPRLIVFFMGNVPHVDLAGAELLMDLRRTFLERGIAFRLAEVHGPAREALRRLGHEHTEEFVEAHQTVEDVLNSWRSSADRPASMSG
jgi:MFS superfamily sulfate permease-like transporter